MSYKTIILMCITATLMLGCGNKEKSNQESTETTNPKPQETVAKEESKAEEHVDRLEEGGHYQSLNGIDIWCTYSTHASASLGTSDWLSEEEIKAFIADREIASEKSLSFRYHNLDNLPSYATVVGGELRYNKDLPHTMNEAKKYQQQLEEKERQEQAEKERQEKIERAERERQEKEKEFREEQTRFNDFLRKVPSVGTTQKDFNEVINMLSESASEYKRLHSLYGSKADPLKTKLVAKQKQVFPLIRERFVNYYRDGFFMVGRKDVGFIQSGTTLNISNDEFYDASVCNGIYKTLKDDMANYRFKKLILRTSSGQVMKQYTIKSKNDTDL